jgi:hypothetical protein
VRPAADVMADLFRHVRRTHLNEGVCPASSAPMTNTS